MVLKVCNDVFIDRIYVVNLEFQIELKELITKQLEKFNLLEYTTFINAIYRPDKPSFGCTLSHHLIYEDMKKNNYDAIMILEDDCELEEFPFNITDPVPSDWQILYPGYLVLDTLSFRENNSFLRLVDARSSHCYIIKKDILNYLIKMTKTEDIPLDARLICPMQRAVPTYGFYPIKAYQKKHISVIGGDCVNWRPIMDEKALMCYNNTNKNIVLAEEWKSHYIELTNK